ncbi:MAG: hypothetical protein HYY95_00880 [Candidatus Rokubacteria bacterium]|nr:hypothetical protein [Candidatus Rokubacteria bacterium]
MIWNGIGETGVRDNERLAEGRCATLDWPIKHALRRRIGGIYLHGLLDRLFAGRESTEGLKVVTGRLQDPGEGGQGLRGCGLLAELFVVA